MAKTSFLLNDEWGALFIGLPDEKAGQLIKAAFHYHAGEDFSIDDPVLSAVFAMIKTKMDENDAKYSEKCARNRQNVGKRWVDKNVPNDTTVYDRIPDDSAANESIRLGSDNDSDNDLKEKNSATQSTKRKPKHQYGEYKHVLLTDEELEKLNAEHGIDKTAAAIRWFDSYIEEKGYKCKSHYLAMRRWVFNAVDERKRTGTRDRPRSPQWNIEKHEYDMSDLESRLIGG